MKVVQEIHTKDYDLVSLRGGCRELNLWVWNCWPWWRRVYERVLHSWGT